jgi:hypothetical protein
MTINFSKRATAALVCAFVALSASRAPAPAQAQPVSGLYINEIQTSGASLVKDEDNSDQDWIEIYNDGTSAVNLGGFGLSDVITQPLKWTFPSISIAPKSFLLVWASGKNRSSPQLHTNFKIDKDGEALVLARPDGSAVDTLPPVVVPADASYGRKPDGSASFAFFSVSSAGASNANGSTIVVAPPAASIPGGFFTSAQQVTLSSATPGATIRYTLDGSEPGPASLLFTPGTPITINDRSSAANVFSAVRTTGTLLGTNGLVPWKPPAASVYKATVLRTRAFSGTIESAVSAATFFISPDAPTRYAGIPVVSITADPDDLFSDARGLYVLGPNAASTLPYDGANFFQSWEKPATIEYFDAQRRALIRQSMGLRLHGDVSRAQPQKSLRLYARNGDAGFATALFASKPITAFQRVVLRNASQDFASTFIRDEVIQAGATANVLTQAYQPTVVFINGEYWGVHNLRERVDEFFLEQNAGVDPRNIDLLEFRFTETEVDAGDAADWDSLIAYLQANALSNDANFNAVAARIDLDNLTDYVLLNVWAVNRDWPGNNVRAWRVRNPPGKWRWISFGSESGFGLPGWGGAPIDNFEFLTFNNNDDSQLPLIMRKLLENPGFKLRFTRRAADLLNVKLASPTVLARINTFAAGIDPLMSEHIQRWGYPNDKAAWLANVDVLRETARQRPDFMRQHMRDRFGLGATINVTITITPSGAGVPAVNTIGLGPIGSSWRGVYFAGMPITASVTAQPGYIFDGWQTAAPGATRDGASLALTPNADVTLTAVFRIDPSAPPPRKVFAPLALR